MNKQEQLQKVLQEHPELGDKLKAIATDSQTQMQEKMIELLKEYGVILTAEDFKVPVGELSDDELNAVAGGGGCGCPVVGGGGGDDLTCVCIAGGTGYVRGCGGYSLEGGCFCAVAGAGSTNRH